MSENLPILYQNILYGLPSDMAREAFLWATDRPGNDRGCYTAEAFAREVHRITDWLTPMMDVAAMNHGRKSHDPDLMRFILIRHANWRFGGNVLPSYAHEAAT